MLGLNFIPKHRTLSNSPQKFHPQTTPSNSPPPKNSPPPPPHLRRPTPDLRLRLIFAGALDPPPPPPPPPSIPPHRSSASSPPLASTASLLRFLPTACLHRRLLHRVSPLPPPPPHASTASSSTACSSTACLHRLLLHRVPPPPPPQLHLHLHQHVFQTTLLIFVLIVLRNVRNDKAMECNHDPLFPLEAAILPISLSLMLKRKDYEFLPVDPNQPLSDHIVYRGMKSQLRKRVRYNRCQVKHECYEVWKNTPEAEREALWRTPAFSWIDKDSWATLCTYYDSEGKKEEARRNEQNRVSDLHGRATYTCGSRNMCRAMEQLKCQIIEDGGKPTMLKLYLGTHSSSVHKITGEYTYPESIAVPVIK